LCRTGIDAALSVAFRLFLSDRASVTGVSVCAEASKAVYLVDTDAVQARVNIAIVRVDLTIVTGKTCLTVARVLSCSRISQSTFRVATNTAVGTWPRRAFVAVVRAIQTAEPWWAQACIPVVHVDACTLIHTRLVNAFVCVDSAIVARPSVCTGASETADPVSTAAAVQARRHRALVHLLIAVVAFIARPTLTEVVVCRNRYISA